MSDALLNAKMMHEAGKYPFIIDTMAEMTDADVTKELGDDNFSLVHFRTYEDCKRLLVHLIEETPDDMRGKCGVVINNIRYLTSARTLQIAHEGPMDNMVEIKVHDIEVPVEDGKFPEPDETVQISEVIHRLFEDRKIFKDLMKTVRKAQDMGIGVVIAEGIDPPYVNAEGVVIAELNVHDYKDVMNTISSCNDPLKQHVKFVP